MLCISCVQSSEAQLHGPWPGGIFGSASNNLEEHEWRNSLGNSSRCYGSKTAPGLIKWVAWRIWNHLKPVRNFRRISQDIFSCSSVASFNNQKKTLRNFARGVMQAPVDVALVIPWNVVKAMPFAPSPSHHRHHHIFIDKYICLPFPVSRVVKMTLF